MRPYELSKTPVCISSSGNLSLNQAQKGECGVPTSPVMSSSPRPPAGVLDSLTLYYIPSCLRIHPPTTYSLGSCHSAGAHLAVSILLVATLFAVPVSRPRRPLSALTSQHVAIPHCGSSLYLLAGFEQTSSGNVWLLSVDSMVAHRIMPCGYWKDPERSSFTGEDLGLKGKASCL